MANSAALDGLISIVLPIFNAEKFIEGTLRSVCEQSYADWEILAILDLKSSDRSESIVYEWARRDPRIRVHRSDRGGVARARNLGIEKARGRWLCFLDSDDLWRPHKLERQVAHMRRSAAAFSATYFRRIDEQGVRQGRVIPLPRRLTYKRLLRQNCICCSSTMLDLRVLDRPRFNEMGCEDFDLWLRILETFDCQVLDEDLVFYRIVNGSRGASKIKTALESWHILRRHLSWPQRELVFGELLLRGLLKHSRF